MSRDEEVRLTAEAERAEARLRRSIGRARALVRDCRAKLAAPAADRTRDRHARMFRFDK